jgi:hypothetical protein
MATDIELDKLAKDLRNHIIYHVFVDRNLTVKETLTVTKNAFYDLMLEEDDWGSIGSGVS